MNVSDRIRIEKVSVDHPELAGLIEQLDRELLEQYEPEDIFRVDLEDPEDTAGIRFSVAYVGEEPAGCGAVRPLDAERMELKRFFVAPSFRRQGIASRLLNALELEARESGCTTLRLETGELLVEAVQLYRKFGFYPIDRYGPYVNSPKSYCMEKKLD